jgi:two-component system phosphate regulon response regulator PhoB
MAKILIVDDEPSICNLLKELLKDGGHVSLEAHDAATAAVSAEVNKPDLIITDFLMPGEPEKSIFRRLADNPKISHIPTILMSAYPLEQIQAYVPTTILRRNHFMRKPLQLTDVNAQIDEVLKEQPETVAAPVKPAPSGMGRVLDVMKKCVGLSQA